MDGCEIKRLAFRSLVLNVSPRGLLFSFWFGQHNIFRLRVFSIHCISCIDFGRCLFLKNCRSPAAGLVTMPKVKDLGFYLDPGDLLICTVFTFFHSNTPDPDLDNA